MKERFIITSKRKLAGEVKISGAKNAANPMLAATLLTREPCEISNLPDLLDVKNFIAILKSLGAEVKFLEKNRIKIQSKSIDWKKMDVEKITKMRSSVLLLGALSSRLSHFKIPHPGGDRIGERPISTHLQGLKDLGIKIERDSDSYDIKSNILKNGYRQVVLQEFSVTATENLILASVLRKGKTRIIGAAEEPHVINLSEMLNKMGAKIKNLASHIIEIDGVKKLSGVSFPVISDYIETGTFLIIGGLLGDDILIKKADIEHLDLFLAKIKEIGVNYKIESKDSIRVKKSTKFKNTKVQALPYPGFPTDLLPIIVPLLTQAEGKSLIHDPLYENRLGFIQELRKMGADIEVVDPHRAFIFGKTNLKGARVNSWDIRAGACLIVAGLIAKGKTTIENIDQIDRGYEKIDLKLKNLGAKIRRVKIKNKK